MSMRTVADVMGRLDLGQVMAAEPLDLAVGHITLRIMCADLLREELATYFSAALTHAPAPELTLYVLDGQPLDPAPEWRNWAREAGKSGRKDAVFDLEDGRLVHKVRTGVTFVQSGAWLVAFGPTAANPNQVVNFVNTQMLNICQRDGWQICHAAAVTRGASTLAIAGLSGGGKSTSILRLMDLDGMCFVTNDRLLAREGRATDGAAQGLGIPKHPRINPGTILGNPRLAGLLSAGRRAELAALSPQDLWQLEEKYDLIIPQIYGAGRIQYAAPLTDFWVLNWRHDLERVTMIEEVDLRARPDLLSAIMKSPGPFYQHADGHFLTEQEAPDPEGYLRALANVRVQEVTGRVDFDAISNLGKELFDG